MYSATWENNTIKYLCIRRKDSLGYVDFMRGKYKICFPLHINNLINEMTNKEKISGMRTKLRKS